MASTSENPTKSNSPALQFESFASCQKARVGKIVLPHGPVDTPVFMPVGTQGTIKGLTSAQVDELGCQIILGNTYHLGLRPGTDVIDDMGGLHKFMNWNRNILTDSGGFQMVSLFDLAEITEEGVWFQSPVDGTRLLLSPERSMQFQNEIGADIMMALDDVCSSLTTDKGRVEEAMHRTIRWLDRCLKAHKKPQTQNLFAIVQGGLDPKLRDFCLKALIERDTPGYAIGGLAGGEDKSCFWKVVHQCCLGLPNNKPRYLMGVGYPLDIVVCCALGVDMFDCVWPCRTARFGTAVVPDGLLNVKKSIYKDDFRPLDETCGCSTCRDYTRAFLHTVVTREEVGSVLMTVHNIHQMMMLTKNIREAISEGRYPAFISDFMHAYFPLYDYPQWAVDALTAGGFPECVADAIPETVKPKKTAEEHTHNIKKKGKPKKDADEQKKKMKQPQNEKRRCTNPSGGLGGNKKARK